MLLAGQLLLEDSPDRCRLVPGSIRISDDRMSEVIVGEIPETYDAGGPHCMIAPGFIDAHLHLPQFDMIGAHGMPLLQWLSQVTFPAERRWEDVDFASSMAKRVFDQCIAHGTTAICAYATAHHASAKAAIQIAEQMRMRGVIGQVLMDREAPEYLCKPLAQQIDQTSTLIELFPSSRRMATAVTPRFAISCTPDLMKAAAKLAAENHTLVQTHLAETLPECEFVSSLFEGVSYVDVYESVGLLTPRTVFGHGIYLNESDRSQLVKAGSVIAHCPTANSFLRSGTMNRHVLKTDQVSLAIGSDIGAGYERSMVRVARAMIEAAASLCDHYPSASEAWHAITAGNANALGWPDAGRIEVGHPADLVVIEPDIRWQNGLADPMSMLLFAWDDRWIKQVLLQGTTAFQSR
jgi:guanine deaminase